MAIGTTMTSLFPFEMSGFEITVLSTTCPRGQGVGFLISLFDILGFVS